MLNLFKENIKIAIGSVKTQLLRTILTLVIIAIGITALVGILTVISALDNTLASNFASMGSNTFSINQYEFTTQRHGRTEREKINPIISYVDARKFINQYDYPFTKCSLSFKATSTAEVKFASEKTDPEISVMGVDHQFVENAGLETQMGRNFNAFDVQNNNYVCILGSDFLKGLFKNINPIGKSIEIRGAKFKVLGVLKEKGSTFGNSQDLRVLIPIQLARSLYTLPNINYNLSILVEKNEFLSDAVDAATVTFRQVRSLKPLQENNFGIIRSDDLINKIKELTQYLSIAAIVISIITVLGSSIALMNIMIVSVTERTREIGLRKALGAKRITIAFQFFIETLFIGQLGGIIGIILGISIGYAISSAIKFEFSIPWLAIFWAFGVSFLVALCSGLYPSIKAAYLDPIESLRYE